MLAVEAPMEQLLHEEDCKREASKNRLFTSTSIFPNAPVPSLSIPMSGITYRAVFEQAFSPSSSAKPYAYQCRLACGPDAKAEDDRTMVTGAECRSQLIEVPTGLGKTAGVVLAWLWNRLLQPDKEARKLWPRRLVYCLPMRTLVEQTRDNVKGWIAKLAEKYPSEELAWLTKSSPIILMGGEDGGEWDIYAEKEAILIGTQDMLLSRALNRGYGMSRYRWPMHFGLLNNDALWVMDETQLMGVTVETSAQLDGFRSRAGWSPVGACPTWWMSATLDSARLATIDHPEPTEGWQRIALSEAERASGEVRQRYEAKKPVGKTELTLSAANKKDYPKQLAALIADKHKSGTLTLVVVNRVGRAREIYAALRDKKLKLDSTRLALIHSRFRPVDRQRHTSLLFGEGDRIVIATQAVEAGVDVSARLLITELAPWSSLVQRFGRCNRRGDFTDVELQWIDVQLKDEKDDLTLPYLPDELKRARTAMTELTDAGPQSLAGIQIPEPIVIRPVLRRRDLVDLFDTTPDLCGQDLDVSRYIRDGEDSDVQLFWRTVEGDRPTETTPPPERLELCRVSIGEAAKFLKKDRTHAWRWNPLDEVWEEAKRPQPGAVYLVAADSGGYSDDEGWTGEPKGELTTHLPTQGELEAYGKDRASFVNHWQDLAAHTNDVIQATAELATRLALDEVFAATLRTAALWHDIGKAHGKFQAMLCEGDASRLGTLWAKSANRDGRCKRRGFRHELASALAWLVAAPSDAPERDLIAYIIAAHHGKVRLSIRALPEEKGPPEDANLPYARGIWHGEKLPAVSLGEVKIPPITLDLSFMQMGAGEHGPSWLARMIALRDRLGPFRLAYLETLLRAADARGSRSINP
jgi:CRISPR-associated endonuclease/helicase Cas3